MVDDAIGEVRLIVDDQLDAIDTGMSAAVTTVNSSQGTAGSNVMLSIRPRATGLRTVTPCSIPGRRDVVDVQRLTGDLGAAFLAAHRAADLRHFHVIGS